MGEETKPSEGASKNTAAEQDVQNVLAELKGGDTGKQTEETAAEKDADANGDKAEKEGDADAEKKEEARIIAAAAKLGEKPVSREQPRESRGHRSNRGGRGGQRVNYRDNVKTDFSTLKETDDPDQIRKQVEFYFSDSNLPMDKFLLSQVGGSANRPVELSVIHSFKRMRRFQPFSAVVAALKDSNFVELTDDDTCVRRKTPLPDSINEDPDANAVKVFEDQAMHRSIYAKGFGEEEPSTQFDIEAFFTPYGPLNAVRLRRTNEKKFKGSVFVEFDSEETQKKFLDLEEKPKWKGNELMIKSKKDYCEEKVKDIAAGRIKPSERPNSRGRGRGRDRRDNGRDQRDWRDRRAEDQKKGFNRRGGNRSRRGGRRDETPERQVQKDSRGVPVVHVPESNSKQDDSTAQAGQKRAHEDDAPNDRNGDAEAERPAKKVDVKDG